MGRYSTARSTRSLLRCAGACLILLPLMPSAPLQPATAAQIPRRAPTSAATLPVELETDGALDGQGPLLEELLAGLGRAAQLSIDNALRFTCRETITHFAAAGRRRLEFDYIYVPGSDGRLVADYRLPHRRRKARRGARGRASRPVSLAGYGLPGVLERPYMWVLFFDPSLQQSGLYSYRLAGRSTVLGREAVGLAFAPELPLRGDVGHWYGTAWIDGETFQLLRVDAVPAAEQPKKLRFEQDLRRAGAGAGRHRSSHMLQQVSTEFGVLRGELRLPSRVTLRRSRFEVWSDVDGVGLEEFPVFRVRQSYTDYRFFGVTTAEEMRPRL